MRTRVPYRRAAVFLSLLLATPCATISARAQQAQADAGAPQGEERQVLQAMEQFFRSIREGDPATVASLLIPTGSLFSERRNTDGTYTLHHLSNADWLAHMRSWGLRVRDDNWNSRVQIWGPIATISQSFVFVVDGRIRHCGINLLQLVKDGQNWRIANIVWTEEHKGCALPG